MSKNHTFLIANPPVGNGKSIRDRDYENAVDIQGYDPAGFNETEEAYEGTIDFVSASGTINEPS